jgi:outer membrane protein OmpA-like peptidoglycan-associated protein
MRKAPLPFLLLSTLGAWAQESYVVKPVDLMPMGQDYAPVLVDSSVVMCSLRERDGLVSYRDATTGDPFSDLYLFNWDGFRASAPHMLSEALTSPLNDGPASFCMKGTTICFTRNQSSAKGKANKNDDRLGLFFSANISGKWSVPVPFDYNSSAYNMMHPAFSPDGLHLYFASDMPGTSGGTDIYRSDLEGEGWSIPMNIGNTVNTAANELFPSIAANGNLYFSSNRPEGLGKLDILQATPNGDQWNAPTRLPEPLNSIGNDMGYTSFATDRSGFFGSDRDGSDRIFSFRRVVPLFANCAEQQGNNYCYSFKEPDLQTIGDLPLHYEWTLGDGSKQDGGSADHCYSGPGKYVVELNLVDNGSGHVFFNEATYELAIDDIHQPYITCVDSLRSGRDEVIDALHTYLPEQSSEEYHWDLGDGSFGEGARLEHDWKTPGEYLVKLAVLGVRKGTERIQAHCVTKRITVIKRFEDMTDAVVASSYKDASGTMHDFDFQALPFDQFSMTVQDNTDVRFSVEIFASKDRISLNDPRFTEIRKHYPVFERYDPIRAEYTYSVGKAETLAEMYEVYKKVMEYEFLDAEVVAIHPDKVTDLSALALLNEQDLDNSVVRASTVLFDNGQATFTKEFEPQLDKVLELMLDHPHLSVVIEAHTDAVGSESNNFKLSQQRAQSILNYLAKGGAAMERLVPVGHGENHPISENTNSEGRAQNRRVEFRLVMGDEQAYERRK